MATPQVTPSQGPQGSSGAPSPINTSMPPSPVAASSLLATSGASSNAGSSAVGAPVAPAATPAVTMDGVFFNLSKGNNHSLINKWVSVDETKFFTLQTKEKKAHFGEQCRIIVRGAKHFPLVLSSGPSTERLYPTWLYVRHLQDEGIPKDITDYHDVERWVKNHVTELIRAAKARAAASTSQQSLGENEEFDESTSDSDIDPDVKNESVYIVQGSGQQPTAVRAGTPSSPSGPVPPQSPGMGPASTMPEKNQSTKQAATSHGGLFKLTVRPQTKEEYKNIEAIRIQVRRNRTVLAMIFTVFYTLLMRYLSFDGYMLFLFILEGFVYYMGMNYRQVAVYFAKRGAKSRVNRVKDWFFFGVRGKDERLEPPEM